MTPGTDLKARINRATALILAGGKSSRLSRDKAMIELGGMPLVVRAAKTAGRVFENVLVSGPKDLSSTGLLVVEDEYRGMGPMAGMLSGLKKAKTPWIFVMPCDSPFIPESFFRGMAAMAHDCEVVVPTHGGLYEPLHAMYAKGCAPVMEELLRSGEGQIIKVYPRVRTREVDTELVQRWDPSGMAFMNINTTEDLDKARRIIAGPKKPPC